MINLTPGTKKLTVIMLIITVIGVLIAYNYYSYINEIEDPRILHIKKIHLRYNQAVTENTIGEAIALLDFMDTEYSKIRHYHNSFERGVLCTDKAAIYLTMALYHTTDEDEKLKFLDLSKAFLDSCIHFYDNWQNEYSDLNEDMINEKVTQDFSDIESDYKADIIAKRIIDIKFALEEIDRRYSVTYTNLGIVMRHKLKQDSAIFFYKKALDLWKDNHVAKSNLNVLMGGEPIKRGMLEKMFPPERDKE
ncbi:MAG: hypothetical protein JXR69_11635 [Candidatus Delongbacteria bacterium]|nr:hypothetical protein [Candidatus Delongbacteria bacterium]